jgi:hypothetical protein
MQAYFTASIVGKRYHLDKYKKILEILKEQGVFTNADHIINTTEQQIHFESKEERVAIQKKLERWITAADFIVVEASFPSISVGYEISIALHRGKPVLVLYSEGDPPSLIMDDVNEKLVVQHYTLATLPEILSVFIDYWRGSNDTRFTFFITSKIASYLEKQARKNDVPKSVYLRTLIQADMKTHK